jgi:hypothetical protein
MKIPLAISVGAIYQSRVENCPRHTLLIWRPSGPFDGPESRPQV